MKQAFRHLSLHEKALKNLVQIFCCRNPKMFSFDRKLNSMKAMIHHLFPVHKRKNKLYLLMNQKLEKKLPN